MIDIVKINETALARGVSGFTDFAPKPESYTDDILKATQGHLRNRYSRPHVAAGKKEKKYNVDFATAKARLQRALGTFKYDNEKSSFLFEKKFTEEKHSVNHKYILSLFPDRNDTVIEFSGEYDYLKDNFGGKDKFGQEDFQQELKEYISQVDGLLK